LRNTADAVPFGVPKRLSDKGEIAELALGTVQLGLSYGVANRTGQPNFETARRIVKTAIRAGISHIDCARAYGDAEERLGRIISPDLKAQVTVVTKLSPLPEVHENMNAKDVQAHVAASVYHSCRNLNVRCLPILLLHRWEHRHSNSERIWVHLKQLQAEGVIGRLGASVQSAAEALAALSDSDISFIQLPFNILDRRLQVAGVPEKIRARRDVTVQARSALLQGLLPSPPKDWPKLAGLDSTDVVGSLEELRSAFGRESIADLCIAYVRAQSWIDCLVVGVETSAQLEENVRLMQRKPLNDMECKRVEMCFRGLPDDLLNPALWPKRS
jgi:aryl-alcohol dehydrogenase-like predicted oxidoreductase